MPPSPPTCIRASTPGPEGPSAGRCQTTDPVPPSRFRNVLTAFSFANVAGLLHPAAGRRVRRVSRYLTGRSENRSAISRFPRRMFTPPEEPPSSAAVPCHHGLCPPAVIIRSAPLTTHPRVPITEMTGRFPPRGPRGVHPRCGEVANHRAVGSASAGAQNSLRSPGLPAIAGVTLQPPEWRKNFGSRPEGRWPRSFRPSK